MAEDKKQYALDMHKKWRGKIAIEPVARVTNREELAVAYTPGVAEPCLEIQKDVNKSYIYTRRWNSVAVVTDGTAVLGLGDIGPEAGMPVMEGKCLLFKEFADIDAYPICIRSKDVDEIVRTVYLIEGGFGGINLEDIGAPRCFEIERKLKEISDIPVFHDDQHGTAIIATAALKNACRLTSKKFEDLKIVISGAGAAGIAIGKLFMACGAANVIFVGRHGAMCDEYGGVPATEGMNPFQAEMAKVSNPDHVRGTLAETVRGADVFLGVSKPGLLTQDMVRTMAKDCAVFAMANPVPEIMPDLARAAGAAVVGTGRSDFPNQINNVLAFPGVFRGALDCRASQINDNMKLAASDALSSLVTDAELNADFILPDPFDRRVAPAVAAAVEKSARDQGLNRI